MRDRRVVAARNTSITEHHSALATRDVISRWGRAYHAAYSSVHGIEPVWCSF